MQRGFERFAQRHLAERLEQALDRTPLDQTHANNFILVGCNEDRRNDMTSAPQLPLKIRSTHAGHDDVDHQTLDCRVVGVEKLYRRR